MSFYGGQRNMWEFRLTKYYVYRTKLWLGGWSYIQLSSYHPVGKFNDYLGIDMII